MAETLHMWNGEAKPSHIDNIKPWTLAVEEKIEAPLRKVVEDVFRRVYGKAGMLSAEEQSLIEAVGKDITEKLILSAREHEIPVWNPTADSYEF